MKIEVSLTPALYPYRQHKTHHTTVAIDLLRATTSICAAFYAGCQSIIPLDSLDNLDFYRSAGFKIAAERNGEKVAHAEYGNSPTEYLRHDMRGIKLAYSSTNGTVSILCSAQSYLTLVGSFANIGALTHRLRQDNRDTVLLCSGWQNDFCIEDTLVAGAIIDRLGDVATPLGDAALMALSLWRIANTDPYAYCQQASHLHRLEHLGAHEDIVFAFKTDSCPVVPYLHEGILTL